MTYGYPPGGGDLGPSGTKVRNTQTDKSQYATYVIQAIIFAVAGDAFILLMALFMLAVGWIGLFIIVALLVLILSKRFARFVFRVCTFFHWQMPDTKRVNVLRWTIVASFIGAFFLFASGWWEWLIARDAMLTMILETITPLLILPIWVYLSLIGLWFFAALKKFGTVTFAAIIGCLLAWTAATIEYTVSFAVIWARARYLAAMLLIPPPVAGLILCYAMFKEMVAPNLNFILDTIQWGEFIQAGGLLGLIFPRYVQWRDKIGDRRVRVAVEDGNGNDKRLDFMDSPKMHDFARAILGGVEFSESTANSYLGYGRKRWEHFRDEFFSRSWAVWKNEDHHQDGIRLLSGGLAALKGALPHPGADVD